jgi:hypothetical protein
MASKKTSSRFAASTVTPTTEGNTVMCSCGFQMKPFNYIEYPSQKRWLMWRCLQNPDHITCMVPEYQK